MKNITLSIPDDVLRKSREYAKSHGRTLNDLVRELLKNTINEENDDFIGKINQSLDELGIDTSKVKYKREDLYER